MSDAIKSKIDALRATKEVYNYPYYVLEKPTEADAEYDRLMREWIALKQQNPKFEDRYIGEVNVTVPQYHQSFQKNIFSRIRFESQLG